MAEKKKVTIVTKKKKTKSTGAADASSPQAGAKQVQAGTKQVQAGTKKTVAKSKPKKTGGLLAIPRLPDLLDFPAGLADSAREVWMAGIGALSTVEEMGVEMFDQLVKKGEHWEQESRKKLTGAAKQASAAASGAASGAKATAESLSSKPLQWSGAVEAQVERMVEDTVEGVLHRLNVPTHDEVQDLIARVQALSGKVDALSARMKLQRDKEASPAPRAASPKASSATPTASSAPKASSTSAPKASSASPKASSTSGATFHVVPHDEGWAVEKEGASRATSVHGTKAEAVTAGRERAKSGASGTLVIHRQDGTFQDTFSYGE